MTNDQFTFYNCRCDKESLDKYFCGGEVENKDHADSLCAGWCQFKGLQTGNVQWIINYYSI